MEHMQKIIFFLCGLLWLPVQMLLTLMIAIIFALWSVTANLLPLDLKQKFLLAAFFWRYAVYLIIRIGLLTKPLVIDRRSSPYQSNLTKGLIVKLQIHLIKQSYPVHSPTIYLIVKSILQSTVEELVQAYIDSKQKHISSF